MSKLTEQLRRLLLVPSPQLEALAARAKAASASGGTSKPADLPANDAAAEPPLAAPQVAVISCMLEVPAQAAAVALDWRAAEPDPTGETALLPAGFAPAAALPFRDHDGPRAAPVVAAERAWPPRAARLIDATDETALPLAASPRQVLPFTPPALPATHDLDSYARLCAEAVHASRSGAALSSVFARHGFQDLQALAALHERWAKLFRDDESARAQWQRSRDQHLSIIGSQEGDKPCRSMCS